MKKTSIYEYKIFFNIFEFSFVPILQWFTTSKQMGVLRPRAGLKK